MGLLMDNEMDHLGFSGSLEPLYLQANFLAITFILILCTVVIVAGTYFCLKAGKVHLIFTNMHLHIWNHKHAINIYT